VKDTRYDLKKKHIYLLIYNDSIKRYVCAETLPQAVDIFEKKTSYLPDKVEKLAYPAIIGYDEIEEGV
jgi:hypothetical protein